MVRQETKKALTAVALGSILFLVGCGQDSVTAPPFSSEVALPQEFTGSVILLPVAERPAQSGFLGADESSVTVLVSAENGGTVRLGRYSLEFPPGALSVDTPITIRQADPVAMIVEFEPHGIQFNKPVHCSARIGDLISSSSRMVGVAWMNEATGQWEPVGVGAAGENAEADLWHFSGYEVFER